MATRGCLRGILYLILISYQLAGAEVRVNELSAATSTRLLSYSDAGVPHLGTTVPWHHQDYDSSAWSSANTPISWDDTPGLEDQMRRITPSLYVRREFTVSAAEAASSQTLTLNLDIDFGYVAYLNGMEVARRNLGPVNAFVAFDHLSYNKESGGAQSRNLGPANSHLVEGQNVLAFQVHTYHLSDPVSVASDLSISGGSTLVTMTDNFDYFVGLTEPSGGVYDLLVPDADGDIEHQDWIELYNDGSNAEDLSGWGLSDNPQNPLKWTFPGGTTIPAGGFLVVMADGTSAAGNFLHTNFSLAASGEAVVLSDATGTLVHSVNPFPEQDYFHSYGWTPGNVWQHLDVGTPGAANVTSGKSDFIAKPDFSIEGGFYDSALTVILATTTPGATIRYTTDGSEPTSLNGSVYSSSLNFTNTTVLRARTFLSGALPSEVATETYLIYDPAGPLGFLHDNPAVSISGEDSRTVYNDNGIASEGDVGQDGAYALRLMRGRFTERQATLEFIYPGNPEGSSAAANAGIRFAGSTHSRNSADMSMLDLSPWPVNYNTRPSMNFFFRGDYGVKSIPSADLIPASSVTKQSTMRLRSGKNDTGTFTRDELVRRAMADMGHPSVIGNFVNVWISGEYKGMFNLTERYRNSYFQEFYDTSDDFDVISSGTDEADSGDLVAWNAMRDYYANNDLTVLENYETFSTMLDIDNFIDFILTIAYAANLDWGNNNWAYVRRRAPGGKFMGLVWDAESTFSQRSSPPATFNMYDSSDLDVDETGDDNPSGEIFTALRHSPEFKLRFADRMAEHLFHDGALVESRWVQRQAILRNQIEETWEYLKDSSYKDSSILEYFGLRLTGLLASGEEEGFWSQTDPSIMPLPPEFSQHGGTIPSEFDLAIANPNSGTDSEVYYTLDESDPRVLGGALANSAQLYAGPIELDGFTGVVSARALVDGVWGPIQDATFLSPTPPPFRITELMYHPKDPSPAEVGMGFVDGDDFEYMELRNVGVSALDISPYALTAGVEFDFATSTLTTLGPGQRVLIVRNLAAFETRHGTGLPVIGTYSGGLKNSSEQILLAGPGGVLVHDFTYSDAWYPTTDGDGFSLEIIDDTAATSTWAVAASWQPSGAIGGSPGTDSSGTILPPAGSVVINEALTHSDGPEGDWIELHNTSASAVDIGGWFLSDDPGTPLKYEIAASTTLPAGGYLVFNSRDHFGPASTDPGRLSPFGLSEKGDEIVLSSGSGGSQTGYQEQESFKGADNGVTFGRHTLSDTEVVFTTLETPTQGSLNSAPLVGPVVISEINYNPAFGGYEYLKILNPGSTAIPFYDVALPANTWQMTNGVDFTFPADVSLAPGAHLVLVPFDPDLSPSLLSDFVALYGVETGVEILGPYLGGLSNGGERVSLSKTGTPDPLPPNEIPLIVVDSVKYNDSPPWPAGPDGMGKALARIDATVIGDEPSNWQEIVTREASGDNADLVSLTLSAGTLAPEFDAGTVAYTAAAPFANDNVTITPTTSDPEASLRVRVNGGAFDAITSGTASSPLALTVGENTIDVEVTAADETTTKTYSVAITRAAPNTNADLSGLILSEGTLSPEFTASTASYEASVADSSASITVTPTAAASTSALEVRVNAGTFSSVPSGSASENLDLDIGNNEIEIRVTAEDSTTVKTYAVTVNRAASGNAVLSALAVSEGALSPEFSGAEVAYEVILGAAVPSTTVTATSEDPASSLEIRVNGATYTPITSGIESGALTLDPGSNVIDVRVTAAGSAAQRVYTIALTRALRVTTLTDEDDGIGIGEVSLREAIEAPDAMIDFDPSLDAGTIVLTNGRLTIEKSVLIDASSLPNGIRVSGNDATRVMKVRPDHIVTLNRVSITDGRTDSTSGAGIENEGNLTLVDLEIASNVASVGRGGGIRNEGTLIVNRVAVIGNTASQGGGLYNVGSEVTVSNSTFTGNASTRGGAISQRGGDVKLINVTMSQNSVSGEDGGGGLYMSSSVHLENTIVAGNTAANQMDVLKNGGDLTLAGTNLIGINDSVEVEFPEGTFVGTESSPVDPGLAPLDDYGGLTRSMALADGSLARDNGMSTSQTPPVDQRGIARTLGSGLDMGAYEAGEPNSGFSSWIAERLPSGSDLSAGQDYDGDGIMNLGEYGILSDPHLTTLDPQFGEIVTVDGTAQDHLLLTFPHQTTATDLTFEVRAASAITELVDGGNHTVIYRFENGTMTESAGFVSRDDGISPPIFEVMDTQPTSSNERRFLQLMTILK